MPMTLSNAPQGLTLNIVPQQPAMQPVAALPAGGLTLGMAPRPDPQFNINTATNTFFKALADRVASGQMTLDQARAAQAQMRQLQLNPQMANRAAATQVAQRALQVGPYAAQTRMPMAQPAPQGLTLSNVPQQQRLTLGNVPMQGGAPQYIGLANQSFQMGDPNFRFGQSPQVKAPNAQGMAMGGLMEKYYGGGMC